MARQRTPVPIGEKFGKLTVVGRAQTANRTPLWACRCECNADVIRHPQRTRLGLYLSCNDCSTDAKPARGRAAKPMKIGQRFGRLIVVESAGKNTTGEHLWRCACDCGGEAVRRTGYFRLVKVAGCQKCESERRATAHITHGETPGSMRHMRSRLYTVWVNMRGRCENPKDQAWSCYGGKGIRVCDQWQNFETFRAWALASGYQSLLTIDRVRSSGNYEPSNCEWVTRSENSRRMWAERSPAQRTQEGRERQARTVERIKQQAVADYIASQAAPCALPPAWWGMG